MTPKNNIFAVLAFICTTLVVSACVTKKKPKNNTEGVTAEYCKAQGKDFDPLNRVCKAADLAFCATHLSMVKGIGSCQVPASQSDCTTLGGVLNKTLTWKNDKCEQVTSAVGQGKLDSSIKIAWTPKHTVQGARHQFVDIGSATFTITKNHFHQTNLMKKAGSTCELRQGAASGKNIKVEAKGPASTCQGKIIVINKVTGDYNVKEFSVTIN